jgi:hypothetical protein
MKPLNLVAIALVTLGLGLLSANFFIGSEEDAAQLKGVLVLTFFKRFIVSALVGALLIGLLTFFNTLLNKAFSEEKPENTKAILRIGMASIALAALLGNLIFVLQLR